MTPTELETIAQRLADRRVDPADTKARRYVGRFFDCRRIGLKIIADVQGNHGTYTVSIDTGTQPPTSACSCYVGAGGGCHHVRALAHTFLDAPASFLPQETRTREQVRTLEDLALYLETTPLETLLAELKAHGLPPRQVEELLGAGKRTLSEAARDEARNERTDTLGALKLACLYLLEWAEAGTRGDDLAEPATLDVDDFLAEIDGFAADCQNRVFYEEEEVWASEEDYTDSYEPELEAFEILADFFVQAERYHQVGEHAVAAAAYEKLFDILWGNTNEWFGFEDIDGWLETDVKAAVKRYLASLGQVCLPEEYVARAWEHVAWGYQEQLVAESTPEQLAALEAHLLSTLEEPTAPGDFMPSSLYLVRHLYEHQGRTEDDLALCRRLCLQYPTLFAPLLDHAEATGDWSQVQELVHQALALAETWPEHGWPYELARPHLESRLSRALEQQGDLDAALKSACSAFYAEPDFAGYQCLRGLAGRISDARRTKVAEEAIAFLREKAASDRFSSYYEWPSPYAGLLAQVLLTEGRHTEAYDLALAAQGSTRSDLLNLAGGFYLTVGWGERPAAGSEVARLLARNAPYATFLRDLAPALFGEAARTEALERAVECYRSLMQMYIDARGRENYAAAAGYAAVLREIYTRQGRSTDFDHWYAQLMQTYRSFRALRDEFRQRLGAWDE